MCSTKMCYFLAVAIFAALCITQTQSAVFTQPAAYNPAYPGKCFDKYTHRAMIPDKEYKPKGLCAVMTCDITTQTINIETCPYIEMDGCEELPIDPRWAFPKCCPQFKCTDFKTGKEFIVSV